MRAFLSLFLFATTLAAEPAVFRIDPRNTYEISPYIYGANQAQWKREAAQGKALAMYGVVAMALVLAALVVLAIQGVLRFHLGDEP